MYTAYVLDDASRKMLADRFPPKYPEFVGHHITEQFGVPKGTEAPDQPQKVEVVGYAEDDGIEALVVAVDGKTERPTGGTYHITWSLDRDKGRKPVHSNKVIEEKGFEHVDPVEIRVRPEVLR